MPTTKTCLELSLPAVASSVREARNTVAEIAQDRTSNERVVDNIRLCVSEAVANVVRHAYGSRPGRVAIVVDEVDGELIVLVRDTGQGLARTSRRAAEGGFGLKIIAKVAARHSVRARPEGGTEVAMSFDLPSDRHVRLHR